MIRIHDCKWQVFDLTGADERVEDSIIYAYLPGLPRQRVQWFGGGHYLIEPYYN